MMAFDTLIMQQVTCELQVKLAGATAQRVAEPVNGEIIVEFYNQEGRQSLLFSIDARHARTHLIRTEGRKNRKNRPPSSFCMLLRKYLIGGRALSFNNPPRERIMEIDFSPPDGLPPVRLIAELMGRRSNLILVDETDTILGAARPVSLEKNRQRAILPGLKYSPPPAQQKLEPLSVEGEILAGIFEGATEEGKNFEQALIGSVAGLSPLVARELLHRASVTNSGSDYHWGVLAGEINSLFATGDQGQLKPVMLPALKLYAPLRLTHLPDQDQLEAESANRLLEIFYSNLIKDEQEKALRDLLTGTVQRRLKRIERKQREQEKDMATAEQAPQYRLFGELLLAYGDRVPKGASSVNLPDLYQPDRQVTVPLDPSRNASANAKHYFNRYRRAKSGLDQVKKQLAKTATEKDYCLGLLYTIETTEGSSLEEIRQELVEAGYLRDRRKTRERDNKKPQPLNYTSRSGKAIMVGRNNRQNDYVTFKAAVRRDTWFHVRQIPGSHVILKESTFPPPTGDLEDAAFLAAYFSKGRDSNAVEVDYTEVRHVRRRPGGAPGAVFYENYKTITVDPRDLKMREYFGIA